MKRFSSLILAAMVGCAFVATSVPAQAKTTHAHDTAKKKKKKKKKPAQASHIAHSSKHKVAKASTAKTNRAPASTTSSKSSSGYKRASVYMKKH